MKYIKRYVIVLVTLFLLYYGFNFFNMLAIDNPEPAFEMIDSFESLKLKIDHLQNQIYMKETDINNLKQAFALNVKYYNDLVERQKVILQNLKNSTVDYYNGLAVLINNSLSNSNGRLNFSNIDQEDLKVLLHRLDLNNLSSIAQTLSYDVIFPQISQLLPHLKNNSVSLQLIQPKFKLSKNRFSSIVIGIPTIRREKTSYLLETLKSLFDSMNDLEKLDILVVIIIAEIEDHSFVQNTIELINKAYKYELKTGLLEIIVPPAEFYPSFKDVSQDIVFNDPAERVKWRTKQNYDFSYLMSYSMKRGSYYLQLEDDVVSKSGFVTTIKDFIKKQTNDKWMMMEFSQLGFIGKLFKTNDLPMFISFFLMFASAKPCDWLFESVFTVKVCNPERSHADCVRAINELKIRYKPSLFQHVGFQSSLKGKTQRLKDKDFGKQVIIAHNNPPAKLSTSLKTYMKYTLESAYLGQNFFWSMAPVANDFLLFEFKEPTLIYKYYIKSGNPEHPDDKLYNSTLHIKTVNPIKESLLPSNYLLTSDNFYIIDNFSNDLGTFVGLINPNITGKISQMRIHIPVGYETWIIITEIEISTQPPSIQKSTTSLVESIKKT